jgi:histidinol-phosphate aminotransferase
MRRNVARVIAMRKKLVQALQKRGFRVYPSAANFLWTRPPAMPAAEWYRSLRARAVLVRHFSGKTTEDFLRITIGKETEMHSLLRALDGILRTATTAGE